MTEAEALTVLRDAATLALQSLESLTTDEYANGGDKGAREALRAALEATEPRPQTFRLAMAVELDVKGFTLDEAVDQLREAAEAGPGVRRVLVLHHPDTLFRALGEPEPDLPPAHTVDPADHPYVVPFEGASWCAVCRQPESAHQKESE